MVDIKADHVLDTKGLNCPMPVLKAKRALDSARTGQILEILATDPGTRVDIPALLNRLGHELIETREENGVISFYIRKR